MFPSISQNNSDGEQLPKLNIGVNDRIAAFLYLLVCVGLAVGAKASPIYLAILMLTELAVATSRKRVRFVLTAAQRLLLIFAGYAFVSALWAPSMAIALSNATALFGAITVTFIIFGLIWHLPKPAVTLRAGWLAIGFVIGILFVAFEGLSKSATTMALFHAFPSLMPRSNSMLYAPEGDRIVSVSHEILKWSAAAISLVFWPVLSIVRAISPPQWRKGLCLALYAICAAIIMLLVVHTTSRFALLAATTVFIVSSYCARMGNRLVMLQWVLVIVSIVPFSLLAGKLELYKVGYATFSGQARIAMWDYTARMTTHHPLHGAGIGATRAAYLQNSYAATDAKEKIALLERPLVHPHNAFLQIWFELGGIGATILLLAGLAQISNIGKLEPGFRPFVHAAWTSTTVIAMMSWDIWYTWFLALLAIACAINCLAAKLAQVDHRHHDANKTFASIWLPDARWKRTT